MQLLYFAVLSLVCLLKLLGVHAVNLSLEQLHGEDDLSDYDNLRDSDANAETVIYVI